MAAIKVATCCYCGIKAALVLRGIGRHELSCGSCGAPLYAMKLMPMASAQVTAPAATPTRPEPVRKAAQYDERKKVSRPGKRKKSKGIGYKIGRKIWSEVWDVIEDVFD